MFSNGRMDANDMRCLNAILVALWKELPHIKGGSCNHRKRCSCVVHICLVHHDITS